MISALRSVPQEQAYSLCSSMDLRKLMSIHLLLHDKSNKAELQLFVSIRLHLTFRSHPRFALHILPAYVESKSLCCILSQPFEFVCNVTLSFIGAALTWLGPGDIKFCFCRCQALLYPIAGKESAVVCVRHRPGF